MKRTIIVLIIFLLTVTFPALSCIVTSKDIHVEIGCGDFEENPTGTRNDFEMEVGDKLYVKLCSNPSTGFEWKYEMSGDQAVKEEDHDFQEPEGDLMGAPGEETWTFEAVKKGTTVIKMEYGQSWEGGTKGQWTYTINIVVK